MIALVDLAGRIDQPIRYTSCADSPIDGMRGARDMRTSTSYYIVVLISFAAVAMER